MTVWNLYKPFHYFFGEYIFSIPSCHFPAVANLLSEKGLKFWNVRCIEDTIYFGASIFTAENIVNAVSEAGITLTLSEKRGFPFLVARYRRRYGLILGFLVGLFLLFYSQLFVWQVNIEGNKTIPSSEIEKALYECGIGVGRYIPNIDVHRDANILLSQYEKISSAAISINGTYLSISVLENSFPPDIVNTSGFYNVIADRDGVILDIDAADGQPEVREGDAVLKGQLLINSFIEGKNGSFYPTHARGIVYAAVEESYNLEIPLSRITKRYTGRSEVKRTFYILGARVPTLFSDYCSYEYFDGISAMKDISLFGFIRLPVRLFRTVYTEYVPITAEITCEDARIIADDALKSFLDELDSEILQCDSEFTEDKEKGVCLLRANAVIKYDIAKEVPYEIDYYNISERLPKPKE